MLIQSLGRRAGQCKAHRADNELVLHRLDGSKHSLEQKEAEHKHNDGREGADDDDETGCKPNEGLKLLVVELKEALEHLHIKGVTLSHVLRLQHPIAHLRARPSPPLAEADAI